MSQRLEFLSASGELVEREAATALSTQLQSKMVKVIQGVRRCGKSSMCKSVLQEFNAAYVNFDDERFIDASTQDLQKILEVLEEIYPQFDCLFFDEIQNIRGWELFVSRLHRNKFNVVLTGSNGKLLGKDLATHLTGRQLSTLLHPFSFKEFKMLNSQFGAGRARNASDKNLFEDYFTLGGFPEVLRGEPRDAYLQELFDKIVGRDIVQRFKVREAKLLKELAIYLIQNSSQKSSFKSLANQFNFRSLTTVRKYVEYLKDVFLISELRGYSFKLTERSTSQPKIYSCDVGLMNALWSKPTQDLGAKLETLVFNHLSQKRKEIYYLSSQHHEVDFAVVHDRKISQLIQVCFSVKDEETFKRETRALVFFGRKYHCKNLLIITAHEKSEAVIDSHKIEIVPFYAW